MSSIDERVVQMEFDNDQFEKGIKQSMRSLDEFKKSLKLEDATKSLTTLEKTAGKISLDPLVDAAKAVTNRFSDMGIVAMVGIERLTNAAINAGHRIINDMITPMRTGFAEYETQINAVQTILANTKSKGTTLDQVNAALDELNTYADKTIYNFTQMTKNIGTFTAAGVDLDTSVAAIKGISNLAAVSGSNAEQASRAMYQLSQALASGTVRLQDWNSVNTAGMGGELFQNALLETARVHGIAVDAMIQKEGSFRESLKKGWLSTEVLLETLKKFTGDLNEAELRSIGYTDAQIASIMELGKMANDSATEVKTFTQLFDTLAESAQSGWTQSWEILIGDFEEAKKLLTGISDALGDIINKQSASRNALLEQVFGTRAKNPIDKSKWEAFSTGYENAEAFKNKIIEVARAHGIAIDDMIASEGSFEASLENGWLNSDIIREAMGNTEAAAEAQAHTFEAYQNIVAEIWQGNWGNGEERFNRLTEAGWDYAFVQELVNATKFTGGILSWEQLTEEQKNYITTLSAGNTEFQDLVNSMQDSDSAINGLLEDTEELSGREKLIAAFTHIWEILLKVLGDIGKVWGIVFPDNRAEFLSGLIDKFYKWVMALEYSSEMGAKVRVVFNGIFSAIAIVVDVVKAVVQGIRNFLDTLPKGDSTVLDFFVKIGLFLGQFRQFLLREGAFNKITEGLTNFLVSVAGFISSLWNDIKNLFSGEGLNFEWLDTIKRWFGKIWDTIKKINFEPFNEFINNAKEFFKNRGFNFEWVGSVKENVSTAFASIGESFSTWAEEHGLDTTGPLEFISSALSNFWNWLTGLDWGPFEFLKTNLSDFWTWLTTNVSSIGATVFDGIKNAVDGVIAWFKEQKKGEAQSPIDILKEKLMGFVTWFAELKDTVGSKIEEVKNKVFAGITGAVSYFIDWVTKKREQLGSLFDVTDKIQAFIEWFKTTGKTIKSKATSIKDTIFAGVAAAIDKFVEWKDTKSTELSGLLEQFNPIQTFIDWFTDLASKAGAQVTEVKDTIFGGISNAIELFIQWKDKKRKQLTDLLKNFHPIQNFLDWFNGLANADNITARITEIKDTVFGGIINAINVLVDWKQGKSTFLAELLNDFHPIQNFLDWFNGLKDNTAATIEDVKDTVFGGIINAIDKLVAWKDTTKTSIENLIGTFDPITDFINWFNDTVANASGDVTSVKDTIFKGVTDAIDAIIAWYNDLSNSDAFAPLIAVRDQLMEFVSWFRGESSESSKSEEKMTIFDVISKHFSDFITWGDTLLSQFGFIENIETKITDFLNFIKDPFGSVTSAITGRTRGSAGIVGGKKGITSGFGAKGLVSTMSGSGGYNIGDTARFVKENITGEDTEITYEDTIFYKIQELFGTFIDWFNDPTHDFSPITTIKDTFNEFVTTITNFEWPEIDVEGMTAFFTQIGEGFGGFLTGISNTLGDINIVENIRQLWEDLQSVFDEGDDGISWIENLESTVSPLLESFGEVAGDFLDGFMEKVSAFAGDVQLKDVMTWLIQSLWALAALATAGGIGQIVSVSDTFGEFWESLTGGNKWLLIGEFGKGLLGFAFAAKLFSEMDDPAAAITNVTIALGELVAAGILTKFAGGTIGLASVNLKGIGIACIGLATAATIFANISEEDMTRATAAVSIMLDKLSEVALASSSYDFGLNAGPVKLNFSKGNMNFASGIGLIGAAAAVAILAYVVEELAAIDDKVALINATQITSWFSLVVSGMAGVVPADFNVGKGLGEMGLAAAVAILAGVAKDLNGVELNPVAVFSTIGFACLVSIMSMITGTGEGSIDYGGEKHTWKQATAGQNIGGALKALGLVAAIRLISKTAEDIHGCSFDDDDVLMILKFAAIIGAFELITGGGELEWQGKGGEGGRNFTLKGASFAQNFGEGIKALMLVDAIGEVVKVADELSKTSNTITSEHVNMVWEFARIVAMMNVVTSGGQLNLGSGKGKVTIKKYTIVGSLAAAFESMALVEAVSKMADVSMKLAGSDISAENMEKGVQMAVKLGELVGQMQVATGIAQLIGGNSIKNGIGSLFRNVGSSITIVELASSMDDFVTAMIRMSEIDSDKLDTVMETLETGLRDILAASFIAGLKPVAIGLIVLSIAVAAIAGSIGLALDGIGEFTLGITSLYESFTEENPDDRSLQGFMDFIEEFLDELDLHAESFGEKGRNIAGHFMEGFFEGVLSNLQVFGLDIQHWLATLFYTDEEGGGWIYEIVKAINPEAAENIRENSRRKYSWETNPIDTSDAALHDSGLDVFLTEDMKDIANYILEYVNGLSVEALHGSTRQDFFTDLLYQLLSGRLKYDSPAVVKWIEENFGTTYDQIMELIPKVINENGVEVSFFEAFVKSAASTTNLNPADIYANFLKDPMTWMENNVFKEGAAFKDYFIQYVKDMLNIDITPGDLQPEPIKVEAEVPVEVEATPKKSKIWNPLEVYDALGNIFENEKDAIDQYAAYIADPEGWLAKYGEALEQYSLNQGNLELPIGKKITFRTSENGIEVELSQELLDEIGDSTTADAVQYLSNEEFSGALENPQEFLMNLLGLTPEEVGEIDLSEFGFDFSSITDIFGGILGLVKDENGNFNFKELGEGNITDFVNGLMQGASEQLDALGLSGEGLFDALDTGFTDAGDMHSPSRVMMKRGRNIADGVRMGIWLASYSVVNEMKRLVYRLENEVKSVPNKILAIFKSYDSQWKQAGENALKGFLKGLTENNEEINEAARSAAKKAVEAAKAELGEHSPSKAFEKIGMYADMGLVNGLTKYSYLVANASTDVADESINNLRSTLSNMASIINGEIDVSPTIRPVLDISNLRASSARISSMFNNRSGYYAMQANGYFNATQALQNAQVDARNSDVVSAINDLNDRIDAQAEALSGLQVVMNTGALVGQLKRPLDRRLGEMAGYRERGI